MVHAFGILLAVVGLFLFAAEQWSPRLRGKDGTAGLKAWKVELGGPPALILIALGVGVFLFPFLRSDTPTPVTTTTTTISTTTTTVPPTTTTAPLPILPAEPTEWWFEWSDDCGDWAVFWTDDPNTAFWVVPVAAMDLDIDSRDIEFEVISELPYLCEWEFETDGYTRYWLWPYGVNEHGEGFELWIEYFSDPTS